MTKIGKEKYQTMKNVLFLFGLILFTAVNTGKAQDLTFKINNLEDTTVHLARYYGSKLLFADTTELKKGVAVFDGDKHKPGMYAFVLPGQKYFEFIHNDQEVVIETMLPDFFENIKVKKSKENQVFYTYINFLKQSQGDAKRLNEERANAEDDERKEEITKQLKDLWEKGQVYQKRMVAENEGTLVAKIINMNIDVKVPEAPKNEDGSIIDSNFNYNYFRDHFFDNIDLTDERLVRAPVFQHKFEYFYSKEMLLQHPDTIFKYLSRVIDQMPEGTEMYQFAATTAATTLSKSKIMGMDRAFNLILERYFCAQDEKGNAKAFWLTKEKLDELCENTQKRLRLVQGEVPPNLILPDSTNNKWYSLHDVDAEYTIVYFWDPNCGHCKKEVPKMGELYNKKFKDRNIEVYSVGKATGEDFEAWKEFIKKHNLTFINVGLTQQIYSQAKKDPRSLIPGTTTLESLNYQDTYEIYSTPRLFILDKDKKIIGKGLGIAQLEEYMDKVQGFQDAEKLFKVEEKEEKKEE
jgi:thiol-disulfide isomerase/thioredoxin